MPGALIEENITPAATDTQRQSRDLLKFIYRLHVFPLDVHFHDIDNTFFCIYIA